jgi:hypothetical protein
MKFQKINKKVKDITLFDAYLYSFMVLISQFKLRWKVTVGNYLAGWVDYCADDIGKSKAVRKLFEFIANCLHTLIDVIFLWIEVNIVTPIREICLWTLWLPFVTPVDYIRLKKKSNPETEVRIFAIVRGNERK